MKRVFIIVLDSFGCGELPDAYKYNDVGTHTLRSVSSSKYYDCPILRKFGIFNIDGVNCGIPISEPKASFLKLSELSSGKDTTTGHWEIAGVVSKKPFPTYPNGFPDCIIKEFENRTGRKTLCNKPYSGTQVINDYGDEHVKNGDLIVYTSADSVFQIAAHEDIVPVEQLYEYCRIAREILKGDNAVGRVIARPFVGTSGNYTRTANRHDFSLIPPRTMLNVLKDNNYDVISVGKIVDIFAGSGITEFYRTKSNNDGMERAIELSKKDFIGLCFINLVDFDMLYGHRNDVDGYAKAMSDFDMQLGRFIKNMKDDDILFITADHGCDPMYLKSTDHSREYIPLLIYGNKIKNKNLHIREGFSDISATILDIFNIDEKLSGNSFKEEIL